MVTTPVLGSPVLLFLFFICLHCRDALGVLKVVTPGRRMQSGRDWPMVLGPLREMNLFSGIKQTCPVVTFIALHLRLSTSSLQELWVPSPRRSRLVGVYILGVTGRGDPLLNGTNAVCHHTLCLNRQQNGARLTASRPGRILSLSLSSNAFDAQTNNHAVCGCCRVGSGRIQMLSSFWLRVLSSTIIIIGLQL